MFRFIVKYLSFLKHIPFLAIVFDALLMIWNSLVTLEVTDAIERIETEVSEWEGVSVSLHRFGGIQFNYNDREIGHIHNNGILDILFSRKMKKTLIEGGCAVEHHIFHQAGWVSFYIRAERDIENSLRLLKLSYKEKQNDNSRRRFNLS